jgi:DNA processing protein
MDTRDILITLDLYCEHDWEKMYKMILEKDDGPLNGPKGELIKLEVELYAILSEGYKVVCLCDDEYPKEILHTPKPPFVIYYKGDLSTVKDRFNYKYPVFSPRRMFVD